MVVPHLFGEVVSSLLFSYTIYIRVLSELKTSDPVLPVHQYHVARGVKSARRLCEPEAPFPGLPLRKAKEKDRLVSPRLLSDNDFKNRNGRVRAKDKGEQASFSITVQCLAQNVTENHNLPLLWSRFYWEYIWQLQSNYLSILPGAEVTGWKVVLRLGKKHSSCMKADLEQVWMAGQVTHQWTRAQCTLGSTEAKIIMLNARKAAK